MTDDLISVEKLAKSVGNKTLYSYANNMKQARSAANAMIGEAQFSLDGSTMDKSLLEVFLPVDEKFKKIRNANERKIKTMEYKRSFFEYLQNVHNIDRMQLEQRAKAKAEKFLSEHPELKKVKQEDLRETSDGWKYSILLEKARKAKNKPVFGKNRTAKQSYGIAMSTLKRFPEFKKYAQDVYKYNDNLLQPSAWMRTLYFAGIC